MDWDINDDEMEAYPPLAGVLRNFGYSKNKHWKPILRRLVCKGANLHSRLPNGDTPLDQLLMWTRYPNDSQFVADEWLEILASAHVDVSSTFEQKSKFHPGNPPLASRSDAVRIRQRRLVFQSGPTPKVHWEWWTNPDGPASLVLNEFRDFGPFDFGP